MKKLKLCPNCAQPIKPGRHKDGEYRHSQGCGRDRSKNRDAELLRIQAEVSAYVLCKHGVVLSTCEKCEQEQQ
jgi:hypothetical protein